MRFALLVGALALLVVGCGPRPGQASGPSGPEDAAVLGERIVAALREQPGVATATSQHKGGLDSGQNLFIEVTLTDERVAEKVTDLALEKFWRSTANPRFAVRLYTVDNPPRGDGQDEKRRIGETDLASGFSKDVPRQLEEKYGPRPTR